MQSENTGYLPDTNNVQLATADPEGNNITATFLAYSLAGSSKYIFYLYYPSFFLIIFFYMNHKRYLTL